MPAKGPAAFISYSRDDSEFALRLAQDLKAAGASVWLDQLDIPFGHAWDNAIEDALSAAPEMLIVLSPSSAKSDNVRDEISFALEQGKIIIPVLYRDCVVPLRLQRTQRIDFRSEYAGGLAALLGYLQVIRPAPAVRHIAVEGDSQRPATGQAREADAKRLGEMEDRLRREEPVRRTGNSAWQQISRRATLVVSTVIVLLVVVLVYALRNRLTGSSQDNSRARADRQGGIGGTSEGGEQTNSPASIPSINPVVSPKQKEGGVKPPAITSATPPGLPTQDKEPIKQSQISPAAAENAYRQAVAYETRQDYTDAARLFQEACNYGDAKGCTAVGIAYERGEGVTKDLEHAIVFYRKGCEGGSVAACTDLGFIYEKGNGVPQDLPKAVMNYKKGCDGGGARGCTNLGFLYENGVGVPKDLQKAIALYQKGCDGGNYPGCRDLAGHYRSGNGVERNLFMAKQLYQKACEKDDQPSCDALKSMTSK